MIPLKELLAQVPQSGEVRWIGVRPASRAPMVEIEAVEARRDAGLTGRSTPPYLAQPAPGTLIQVGTPAGGGPH